MRQQAQPCTAAGTACCWQAQQQAASSRPWSVLQRATHRGGRIELRMSSVWLLLPLASTGGKGPCGCEGGMREHAAAKG